MARGSAARRQCAQIILSTTAVMSAGAPPRAAGPEPRDGHPARDLLQQAQRVAVGPDLLEQRGGELRRVGGVRYQHVPQLVVALVVDELHGLRSRQHAARGGQPWRGGQSKRSAAGNLGSAAVRGWSACTCGMSFSSSMMRHSALGALPMRPRMKTISRIKPLRAHPQRQHTAQPRATSDVILLSLSLLLL